MFFFMIILIFLFGFMKIILKFRLKTKFFYEKINLQKRF